MKRINGRKLTAKERAWEYIYAAREVSLDEVIHRAEIGYDNARHLLNGLAEEGILEKSGRRASDYGSGTSMAFSLVRKPAGIPELVSQFPDWRQEVWNTLRIMQRVTVPNIMITLHTDVKEDTVYRYVKLLCDAGYLVKRGRKEKAGQRRSYHVYQLLRNTGPFAPNRAELLESIPESQETVSHG